jgi:hypothetical protein
MSVVRLIASREGTAKPACTTCAHRRREICGATGALIVFERSHRLNACGSGGHLWEKAPDPEPWPGLFVVAWRFLFGRALVEHTPLVEDHSTAPKLVTATRGPTVRDPLRTPHESVDHVAGLEMALMAYSEALALIPDGQGTGGTNQTSAGGKGKQSPDTAAAPVGLKSH